MRENIDRTKKRGADLDNLENQTTELRNQSERFKTGAHRIRKQMWWKDMKMRICIIVGIIILLIVIIVPSGRLIPLCHPLSTSDCF